MKYLVETKKDKEFNLVLQYLNNGWPKKICDELKPYTIRKEEIWVEKGILMWGYRLLISKNLRDDLLKKTHVIWTKKVEGDELSNK